MLRNSDRENASSYNAGLPLGLQTKLVLALIISSFTLYLGKFLHIALPFWMFLDKPTLMLALHIAPTKLPALWLAPKKPWTRQLFSKRPSQKAAPGGVVFVCCPF